LSAVSENLYGKKSSKEKIKKNKKRLDKNVL